MGMSLCVGACVCGCDCGRVGGGSVGMGVRGCMGTGLWFCRDTKIEVGEDL